MKNYKEIRATAQANANRTGVAWKVFEDTSGNIRQERLTGTEQHPYEPVLPRPRRSRPVRK